MRKKLTGTSVLAHGGMTSSSSSPHSYSHSVEVLVLRGRRAEFRRQAYRIAVARQASAAESATQTLTNHGPEVAPEPARISSFLTF